MRDSTPTRRRRRHRVRRVVDAGARPRVVRRATLGCRVSEQPRRQRHRRARLHRGRHRVGSTASERSPRCSAISPSCTTSAGCAPAAGLDEPALRRDRQRRRRDLRLPARRQRARRRHVHRSCSRHRTVSTSPRSQRRCPACASTCDKVPRGSARRDAPRRRTPPLRPRASRDGRGRPAAPAA